MAECCLLTVAAVCPLSNCPCVTRGCLGACMNMPRLRSVGSDGLQCDGVPVLQSGFFSFRAECAAVPVWIGGWWRVAQVQTWNCEGRNLPLSEWSPGPGRTRRGNAAERNADTRVPFLALVGVRGVCVFLSPLGRFLHTHKVVGQGGATLASPHPDTGRSPTAFKVQALARCKEAPRTRLVAESAGVAGVVSR